MANVLKCRPEITAKRKNYIKTPSVIRAEFTREREELDEFRMKLRQNLQTENAKQRQRVKDLKKKYDKEGVQVIENLSEIGKQDEGYVQRQKTVQEEEIFKRNHEEAMELVRRDGTQLTKTKSGKGYKPGGSYMRDSPDLQNYENRNLNMGGNKNDNPF